MNRIRLLSEHVANQIAAGEVIERPASVVKELVENALDAQAHRLTVEIQAGGRSLIRVTDDGVGMSRDDALLCFERHATSKLHRTEDLLAIRTLGFRGEALPSIASVSRLVLTTREASNNAIEATQVVIHGGKIVEVRTASSPPGTSLEVRQLFYNLPARRKFLRSEETERAHVLHYLLLVALAYPEVGLTFTQDQRVVWQLPPVAHATSPTAHLEAVRERLRSLYGSDLRLVAVDVTGDLDAPASGPAGPEDPEPAGERSAPDPARAIRIWGFIGAPGVSRATREDQHLFVNRRPVENRGLNFALLEGYHTALMKGRYPVCCLFLEIDPARVDVNIHPTKREVKFREEWAVRHFVSQAVRQSLLGYHTPGPACGPAQPPATAASASGTPSALAPAAPAAPELPMSPTGAAEGAPELVQPPTLPAAANLGTATAAPAQPSEPAVLSGRSPAGATEPAAARPSGIPQGPVAAGPEPAPVDEAARTGQAGLSPLLSVPLRLVGVVGRLYVVLESDRGLVLLDQHAAHERVLFEQMLHRLEQGGDAPCQRLLLPETVELSVRDAQFLREHLPVLGRLGVGLSEFGERTFLLDGLPAFVHSADPRGFVLELIDALKAAGHEVNALRLGEHVVAKTVCRHAIKAHDPLAEAELEELIAQLRRCAMPYTCPHGRPTLIEFNYRELERRFGRAQ